MTQLLTYQISSMFPCKEMTFRISIQDGTQALLSANEVPKENVLGSLYKMKIRESVQLQTVLATYKQEIDRGRAMPKLSKIDHGERHPDQMIRTRNFRAGVKGLRQE